MDKNSIIDAAAKFAHQSQGQHPVQPQVIQPQPVPMSFQLANAVGPDGKPKLVMMIYTPVGQSVFFFEPEQADQIADALKDASRVARTGLEIPRLS